MIGIRGWALSLAALVGAMPGHSVAAERTISPAAASAADVFRTICVAHGARMDEVVVAARAIGFGKAAQVPPLPAGFTKVVPLERGSGSARQILIVSAGQTEVSKRLTVAVPARACAVTDVSAVWNVRAFAKEWIGLDPLFDADGIALYSYIERKERNVAAPDVDSPGFLDGLNAGELRTVAASERGGLRALSWVVFEAPPKPITLPAAVPQTPSHGADPFAPCRWGDDGKGRAARRSLSCPDKNGKFRIAASKGVTEQTPTLAQGGDVAAMLSLATFYADGPETARDLPSSFLWSKRAADAGAPGGAFNVGLAYDDGIGVAADKMEAERLYQTAADRGQLSAMINLAALRLARPMATRVDEAAAAALVRRAADAGSVDGLFDMGNLSEHGRGLAKDIVEAQRWYRLAADRKDTHAMLRLGIIFADGIGGATRDEAEAARWMVASVTPTLSIAKLIMGIDAFVYGFDDPKRRAEIVNAAAPDPFLAVRLGMYLLDKKTPDRNPVEALRLLRIAADGRIPLAALRIGIMYAEGDGVPKSDADAIKWLRLDTRLNEVGLFRRVTRFTDAPGGQNAVPTK